MKKYKIIIIGFGSIGQRHYRNLTKLGFKEVWVFDINKKKLAGKNLKIVSQLTNQELKNFDVAFICNPNSEHISAALKCAQAGCQLFIEKPLSHNLAGVSKLAKLCQKNKLITLVGCNMRFHPCLKFVKNYLAKNKLGKIYSFSHEYGYYLPYWRPNQDYRKNYAAKKSSGGGIILDDIHEFDLLFWLNNFKEVAEKKFIFDKLSDLEIETEDICLAEFKFVNKVLGFVKCDYLQQSQSRNFKIVGAAGNLEVDLIAEVVYLKNQRGSRQLFQIKRKDDNDDFIDEIKYFFNCLAKKQETFNNVSVAAGLLKNIFTAKQNIN